MDMSNSFRIVLTALALAFSASGALAYEVSVGTFVANPGRSVTVPVAIDNARGLAYAGVRLMYDPQVLVLVKVSEGTLGKVFTSDFVSAGDLSEGWVSASIFARETVATSLAGTIANVTFLVREGTEGLYSDITVAKVDLGEQIYRWRQQLDSLGKANPTKKLMSQGMKYLMERPPLFNTALKLAPVVNHLPRPLIYHALNAWGQGREMPRFAKQSFNEMWKKNQVQK